MAALSPRVNWIFRNGEMALLTEDRDDALDVVYGDGVHAGEGFIEHDELGLGHQRARDLQLAELGGQSARDHGEHQQLAAAAQKRRGPHLAQQALQRGGDRRAGKGRDQSAIGQRRVGRRCGHRRAA